MTGITINGRFLTRPATGVDRYATELSGVAAARNARHTVKTVLPSKSELRDTQGLPLQPEKVGALKGHAWEQLELPRHCGDDTLINLCNTGPVSRRRQLVVLHDAGIVTNPATYSFAFRSWYRWLFSGLMRRAGIVATVSKFSAGELMKHIGRRASGIELIPGAGEHVLRVPADTRVLERLGLGGQRYVLAVGSRTPNKNLSGVLSAAASWGISGARSSRPVARIRESSMAFDRRATPSYWRGM